MNEYFLISHGNLQTKRENYLDSEVERRLQEAENTSNPPVVPAESSNTTNLKE